MEDTLTAAPQPTPVIDHTIVDIAPTRIVSVRPPARDGRIDTQNAISICEWNDGKGSTIYTSRHYGPNEIAELHTRIANESRAFRSQTPGDKKRIENDFRKFGRESIEAAPYAEYLTSHMLHETVLEIEKRPLDGDPLKGGF